MKIVTFNIRCDYGQDGQNNFSERKPLILETLRKKRPDILCFQEVLPHVAVWLKEVLTDYYVVGCGRSETLQDEQMTIAYRKDSLNLMQMESFWLSETPFVPGSRYADQSICPRICTEVVLQEMQSGALLRVVDTHLDHIGPEARRLGLRQIMEKLKANTFCPAIPAFLVGDFNAQEDEIGRVMDNYPEFCNLTKDIGVTFHGFGKAEPPCGIDYIYASGGITPTRIEKWTEVRDGVYLSDHYPVMAEFTLE